MTAEVCVLLDTPGINEFINSKRYELDEGVGNISDIYTVVHTKNESVRPVDRENGIIYLSNSQIFDEVAHEKDISKGLIPGNLDLKIVRAVREVPNYKYYVWLEFDVMCTRDISEAFSSLLIASQGYDFVASYIGSWRNDGWMWWGTLRVPRTLDIPPSAVGVKAFLPLMVFTKEYINSFEEQLALGWAGHSEVTMATIAHYLGFKMRDLSTINPPITHYPQFNVIKADKLEILTPDFIHPIKTFEDREIALGMINRRVRTRS